MKRISTHFLRVAPWLTALLARSIYAIDLPKLNDPLLNVSSVEEFASEIIGLLMYILLPAIVVMIVIAGFMFIKAQGNPEQLKSARKFLLWTLIGATVVLGGQVIRGIISGTVEDIEVLSGVSL
jgi:hypothetical protein